ncbi:hypothetical protein LTR10_015529 [Elasticomyces elasticus]|uniref:Amino acid permease/ SLC12A domain-containing protein n=1 Tax=Exophiala sideris TaxID=1016849 RepID=A0ABR0JKY3_9EURO|nr:hypothetical protein LTR10_015529 [Elasticomyces elasticus]KAK5032240.1 hypothetical protein LTR13_007458 [Exophiala sideris]KAK5036238.1 hypothetical protein LTS07_001964 [Exophiala sideris]KAK5066621.1 hypothetical protein LTR69_001968 [Exophiala sideris]KAK5180443.1 hypothetical protein LTR44_007201 [Eurotiomycetes sp. CCFEE 6388]
MSSSLDNRKNSTAIARQDSLTSAEQVPIKELVNASGHVQELDRQFNLVSLAGCGLVVGNVWPALGGSILVAIYNGGAPGVLYEFIAVSIFYWIVAASIAELASAIPSSAGVYHWASVTPGRKWGRVNGFFGGYWNWLAWVFGCASMAFIFANTVVQMYGVTHADFVAKPWHVFVVYLIVTWLACFMVCCFNRAMPYMTQVGIFLILAGFLITVIVCAAMPGRGGRPPHATSSFVWTEWNADIGYSGGLTFLLGMLNGAFAVGTPDVTTHLAEEIPNPQRKVPQAIFWQMAIGFVTGFLYLVSILYAINDYDALFDSAYPIAEIYRQATGSAAGAIGLMCLLLFCITLNVVGVYITAGRTLWTLARDRATPFPHFFSQVNPRLGMPLNATIACAIISTILGCIYVGSTTAFNAFVGSYVLMSSASYLSAVLPHLLTGRKNIVYGPFRLPNWLGFTLNFIGCGYMLTWFVLYSFPFALPVDAQNMNYACLIWGGLTIFVAIWWFIGPRKNYEGPVTVGGTTEVDQLRRPSVELRKRSI